MTTTPLKEAWTRHQAENPHVRIRDAAAALGVSEAELLATGLGDTVTRLSPDGNPAAAPATPDASAASSGSSAAPAAAIPAASASSAPPAPAGSWGRVLERLPTLGRVMALTRNAHCVHERAGTYQDVGIYGAMGSAVGPEIDLRFFLNHWHAGFAVHETDADGAPGRSLQFFDRQGTAIHKVFLQAASDVVAFDALVHAFRAADQTPRVEGLVPAPAAAAETPDAQIDRDAFRQAWEGLQDTHEFFGLLKTFGVSRVQALRLADPALATPVDAARGAEALLRAAAAARLPIMVFVGNQGMIQIHTGSVERIAPSGRAGEWINVLDADFSLHLRQAALTRAWAVRKPTAQGHVTSVEFYDAEGGLAVQFFGKRKPGSPELAEWRALAAALPAPGAAGA